MMYQVMLLFVFFIPFGFINKSNANESTTLLEAKKCSEVDARLERLDCFDNVFNTSAPEIISLEEIKPEIWSRGIELEKNREVGNKKALVSTLSPKNDLDVWVTLPSINNGKNSAILMMSCINNISRIDILLSEKIAQARINLYANSFKSMQWKTDDTGFILSSARGVFAISLMKEISLLPELELRSDVKSINGLKFNTDGLSSILVPLRKRCQW